MVSINSTEQNQPYGGGGSMQQEGEKSRARPRKPDMALYVPKARRETAAQGADAASAALALGGRREEETHRVVQKERPSPSGGAREHVAREGKTRKRVPLGNSRPGRCPAEPRRASAGGQAQHCRHDQSHLAPEKQQCGGPETNIHPLSPSPQEPRQGQAVARPGGSEEEGPREPGLREFGPRCWNSRTGPGTCSHLLVQRSSPLLVPPLGGVEHTQEPGCVGPSAGPGTSSEPSNDSCDEPSEQAGARTGRAAEGTGAGAGRAAEGAGVGPGGVSECAGRSVLDQAGMRAGCTPELPERSTCSVSECAGESSSDQSGERAGSTGELGGEASTDQPCGRAGSMPDSEGGNTAGFLEDSTPEHPGGRAHSTAERTDSGPGASPEPVEAARGSTPLCGGEPPPGSGDCAEEGARGALGDTLRVAEHSPARGSSECSRSAGARQLLAESLAEELDCPDGVQRRSL
ncbi:uncharacterized protein [Emydura macquarii macquarii]|uniref:uncharacterized protein n=1 Tax=Emydura macquarii macquarii TaxID=1129001 RepID=UPI00352A66CD